MSFGCGLLVSPLDGVRPVSVPVRGLSPFDRPRGSYVPRFILPCDSSPSEFLRAQFPLGSFRPRAVLPGSLPSSRHHRRRPLVSSGTNHSLSFRPQAFTASRRFAPRTCLRACFIPLPRPGFVLFKGFSPRASHPSSSEGACPRAVVSSSLHASASTFAETNALPRAMPLGFEAFIWARPRSTSSVIHLTRSRSPLQFPLLQVPFLSRRRPRFTRSLPLMMLRDVGLHALRFALRLPGPRCVSPFDLRNCFATALRQPRLTITLARPPTASSHREPLG
jgi:hypothetical protein